MYESGRSIILDGLPTHPRPWRVDVDNFFRIMDANGNRVTTAIYPAGEWFAKLVVDAVNKYQGH